MESQPGMPSALLDCTEVQREAIQHGDGPLLVLAGPGSGKTRVITRRVAWLIAGGCRPDEILAITFTNKAAGEMRDRVDALGAPAGTWIFTFHAFCARVLRIYGERLGLNRSFTIYDTADTRAAVKRVMGELHIDPALIKPSQAAKSISTAKGRLWGPERASASRMADEQIIGSIYARYAEVLRAANAVDFDDLLLLTVRLFRKAPKARESLCRRFRHVLIDEYQDTNHAQYLIAKHLAAEHRNICATGDPDQSIYGWRGADINNILRFERDYPDAKVVRLEQNYRSTKRILSVADKLISHNLARRRKSLWTENPEGDRIRLFRCEDERAEAEHVAGEIAGMIRSSLAAPRDIAVFYRTNAQSRVLESALQTETVPYVIVAGTEFYQRKEVKDLVAYLRLVVNPADDVSVERVANVPPRRLGAVSVKRLTEWADRQGLGLLEAMARAEEAGVKGPALQGAKQFLGLPTELRAMPASPVAAVVRQLIDALDYEEYLSDDERAEERIENVRELVNAAAEFDRLEPDGDLSGFLERVALISDVDRWDRTKGSVTLMTLHAAKGLEFPVVFIVGLEEGLLPLARDEFVHDMEEERRLLFVGLTRARQRVMLSYAESRSRFGKSAYAEASSFLSELPEDVSEERVRARPGAGREAKRFRQSVQRPRTVRRSDTETVVYDGEQPMDDDWQVPFEAGDQVVHSTYGRGWVVELRGYGDSATALVRFPDSGVKNFKLSHAGLRRAGN